MLAGFPEPSRSRMRKRIRHKVAALQKQGTEQADAQARHTFREFLPAWELFQRGFDLEYEKPIGGQKPDWFDDANKLVLEVFTCERGGNPVTINKRVADAIATKVSKYANALNGMSLRFVVAVHPHFDTFYDDIDCEDTIRDHRVFEASELSGVLLFAETNIGVKRMPDGTMKRRQFYGFHYFPNPTAGRPIDLSPLR